MPKITKSIKYIRHSKKGTGNSSEIITQEGLDFAQEVAVKLFPVTRNGKRFHHIFCGPLLRTWQTALAICCALGVQAKVHEVMQFFGDTETFKAWKEFGVNFRSEITNFEAMQEGLNEDNFKAVCDYAANGVSEMFKLMHDNEDALAIGHSPVIELAAYKISGSVLEKQLREMDVVIFNYHYDGKISVDYRML